MSGLLAWSFLGTGAKHVSIERRSVMRPWKALRQARGRLPTLLFEHCFPFFLLLQPPTFFAYVKVCDFLIRVGGRLRSVHLPREIYGFRKPPLHFVGDIGTGATNELPPVHGVGIDEPKMSVVDLEGSGRAGKGGNGGEPRGQVRELTYQEHLPHI